MEIKIKLPRNIKITCPTVEAAITILNSISLGKGFTEDSNQESFRPNSGLPATFPGRTYEGESAFVHNFDPIEDDDDAPSWEDARYLPSLDPDSIDFENEPSIESSQSFESFEEFKNEDEVPETLNSQSEFDTNLDGPETERNPRFSGTQRTNKTTTRSRFSVSLDGENHLVENDSVSDNFFQKKSNQIFQPIEYRMKDGARAVFNFIQSRQFFSITEVNKHLKNNLKIKLSKKNKKKILKTLESLEKNGKLERISRSVWKRVS